LPFNGFIELWQFGQGGHSLSFLGINPNSSLNLIDVSGVAIIVHIFNIVKFFNRG